MLCTLAAVLTTEREDSSEESCEAMLRASAAMCRTGSDYFLPDKLGVDLIRIEIKLIKKLIKGYVS